MANQLKEDAETTKDNQKQAQNSYNDKKRTIKLTKNKPNV